MPTTARCSAYPCMPPTVVQCCPELACFVSAPCRLATPCPLHSCMHTCCFLFPLMCASHFTARPVCKYIHAVTLLTKISHCPLVTHLVTFHAAAGCLLLTLHLPCPPSAHRQCQHPARASAGCQSCPESDRQCRHLHNTARHSTATDLCLLTTRQQSV
jgi:hypothetical protein